MNRHAQLYEFLCIVVGATVIICIEDTFPRGGGG